MNWYIVDNLDKIGPFSKDALKHYFDENGLGEDTLVQSDKMNSPMRYTLIFRGSKETKLPDLPNLPQIPSFERETEPLPEIKTKAEEPIKKVEVPKKSTLLNEEKKQKVQKELIKKEEVDDFDEETLIEVSRIDIKDKFSKKLLAITLGILTFLIVIYLYFYNYSPSFSRPEKMSLKSFREAQNILDGAKLRARVFLSKDKRSLWLITNNFVEGKIKLTLLSIKDKILSKGRVEVVATAELRDGVAEFKNFIFEKGEKLIDGEYMMSINSENELDSSWVYFLKDKQKNLNFRKKTLISNYSKLEFSNKLNDFIESIKKNKSNFLTELVQKYITLKTMVEEIKESFLESFSDSSLSFNQRSKKFEDHYTEKFGPFFTSFVIANEKQYETLNQKTFDNKIQIISDYTRLSRIAKEVGLSSVEVIESFEAFNFATASVEEILNFKNTSIVKFDTVINECKNKIDELQDLL